MINTLAAAKAFDARDFRHRSPAVEAADRVAEGAVTKSAQLLPVSRPSGKRPALVLDAVAAGAKWPEATGRAGRSHVAATLP